MREILKAKTHPETNGKNIVQGEKYRISVLTEGLLRLEYSPEGYFEDRATQAVWNRDFPEASFTVKEKADELEIFTGKAHLIYDKKEFSANGLSIQAVGDYSAYHSIWHYGEEFQSLGGTARTLDMADGEIPLEDGVIGINGFSVMDDSRSLVLNEDGWVEPRRKGGVDIYFWAYGRDYLGALKDFYYLCGKSPMVPRYALGNWWSRYYEYTEDSYKELMERFEKEQLPFSVAVVDMDWHVVDIDPKYGSGWTGYTWNRELFPEPERFLKWLHDRNMHVTLNIHPADGIRAHEEVYPQMAEAMGVDAGEEQPVVFDPANPEFLEACFEHIFHPQEEAGVDFWWIDWQSGGVSKVEGLDPLWVLNHYHYLDNGRDGKRPMTFSRYAGPGSHRYPIGFSGDTIVTWDSLAFQPYFTATASNIGYGMWSHDIGGHMMGERSDEMAGRWLQFGVFSPIMRLHSSKSEFTGKEPWRYRREIRDMMGDFLRLRHRLVPYLYTMNHRAYAEDIPLILPMYYHYPEQREAYQVRNQYEFGDQMIAAPITSPAIPRLNAAKVKVWLPEGIYYDFFTGRKYRGGRMMMMYRDIQSIPVLAKAGAIVPMTDEIMDAGSNPRELCIQVFAGADGVFALYEDDNVSKNYEDGQCAVTNMRFSWGADAEFVIEGAKGCVELLPERRDYKIQIRGVGEYRAEVTVDGAVITGAADGVVAAGGMADGTAADDTAADGVVVDGIAADDMAADGAAVNFEQQYDSETHTLACFVRGAVSAAEVRVRIRGAEAAENDRVKEAFVFLERAEIAYALKDTLYQMIKKSRDRVALISELQAMELDADLLGALMEIIAA